MVFKPGNLYGRKMLGYKHTDETRAKIKAARAQQVITDAHKKAISESMVGGNATSFKKGNMPWNIEGREEDCRCGEKFKKTSGTQKLCGSVAKKHGCAYKAHNERKKLYQRQFTDRRKELHKFKRSELIKWLGGKCRCCNESTHEFLSFEHKNGGGTKHRKSVGGNMVRWLYGFGEKGLPEDIELLCFNCNCAKGFYGKCPHKN